MRLTAVFKFAETVFAESVGLKALLAGRPTSAQRLGLELRAQRLRKLGLPLQR